VPEAAVQVPVVGRVVAVPRRLEERPDIQGAAAQAAHMVEPVDQPLEALNGRRPEVVLRGGAEQAQRVDVVEDRVESPSANFRTPGRGVDADCRDSPSPLEPEATEDSVHAAGRLAAVRNAVLGFGVHSPSVRPPGGSEAGSKIGS